jgi:predicted nucleic acid-binding protein
LDLVEGRQQSSLDLFKFLISRREWRLYTSTFAKVEVYEKKQKDEFRRHKAEQGWSDTRILRNIDKRDLSAEVLESISKQVDAELKGVIEYFEPLTRILEDGWDIAEEIKGSTNLTDKDSIHLAEARAVPCNILLTRDEFLTKIAKEYIWVARPEEVIDTLGIRA